MTFYLNTSYRVIFIVNSFCFQGSLLQGNEQVDFRDKLHKSVSAFSIGIIRISE